MKAWHQFEWTVVWPDRPPYEAESFRFIEPGIPDINFNEVIPARKLLIDAIEGWLK